MSTTVLYVYPYIWNDVVVVHVVVHVHVSGSFWNTKMHMKMNKSSRGKKNNDFRRHHFTWIFSVCQYHPFSTLVIDLRLGSGFLLCSKDELLFFRP